MASFISITDIETSTGTTISSADEPRIQWYIDAVCSYIETTTGQKFSPTTATLRCQADSWGVIEFPQITSITTVEVYDPYLQTYSALTTGDYAYDGISKLYNFCAYETVRLNLTYGWPYVPEDIAAVATDLVKAGSGLEQNASSGLSTYRVGDVEEQYGVTNGGVVTLHTLMTDVMHIYSSGNTTWRL